MKNELIKTSFKTYIPMINTQTLKNITRISYALLISCIISVTVSGQCDNINLACNSEINVSINEDCYAIVTPDLILESPPFAEFPDNGSNYRIVITDESASPDTVVTYTTSLNTVGQEYIGKRLSVSVQLIPCGISCWGYINIEDKIGPKIWDCNNGFLADTLISCDVTNPNIVEPTVGGICADINPLSFEDDTLQMTCVGPVGRTIVRTWVATDHMGNVTTCKQNINFEKVDLNDVIFPLNFTGIIESGTSCSTYSDLTPDGLDAFGDEFGYPSGIFCSNIMYFYSDIHYPQCGAQVKMLRDWFVIDWCTGASRSRGQIIKVIDQAPPVNTCPLDLVNDSLYIDVNAKTCLAYPVLNPMGLSGHDLFGQVELLSDCSTPITIEVGYLPAIPGTNQPISGPYNIINSNANGLYELPAVEQAAWVRYCFTDACGNSTSVDQTPDNMDDSDNTCCYFEIVTRDAATPTAICEGFTKIPLLEGDIVEVPADVFDDHSYDPCGTISHFEVKRESTSCTGYGDEANNFQSSIHFCCSDVGDTITIRLRVYDIDGNMSECLGLVCIEDQGHTSVSCMATTVELDCDESHTNRSLTGVPNGGSDECDNDIRVGDDMFDLSDYDVSCGIGTIVRTVNIYNRNSGALLRTCTQNIVYPSDHVPNMLQVGDYTFPADVTIDICDSGFSTDPDITGKPLPSGNGTSTCINTAISKDDLGPIVDNNDGVCYIIRRQWKVVDWCRYDPDYPDLHVLKGEQIITVTNSGQPTLVCPVDVPMFEADPGECEADVDISVSITSTCNANNNIWWSLDLNSDGSNDHTGTGDALMGTYPVGTHKLVFRANNDCGGSEAMCMVSFVVKGDKGPLPICHGSVILPLGEDGTVEVWASDFNIKSESGCNNDTDLVFSFVSPNEPDYPQTNATFTCDDIPNGISAQIPLVVYVIDGDGQFSACSSILTVQDTKDVCTDMSNSTVISGEVFTENLEPVEDVMVELNDMMMGDVSMYMTDQSGDYAFSDVAYYRDYMIKPVKDTDYLNGVSTLDIVIIQKHILGVDLLDSPYKMIAADIDDSGSITAVDLIELRKLVLGVIDELPEVDSWVFVSEEHEFSDEFNPYTYQDHKATGTLYDSDMQANFYGIKMGDVNGTAKVNLHSQIVEKRSSNKIYLSTDNYSFDTKELVSVPLVIEKASDINGLQFTMEFDQEALTFVGMDGYKLAIDQNNFALLNNYEGVITFSANDNAGYDLSDNDLIATAYFEAKKSSTIGEVIEVSSAVTKAEAYNAEDEIMDLELVIRNYTDTDGEGLEVFQNEPNPFSAVTEVTFYTPVEQEITLSIFDSNGQMVLTTSKLFKKGINAFTVNSIDINSNGVLLYRIDSASSSVTRKMIMVK